MQGRAERGKGPGLIGQDVEQSARHGREVAGLCSQRLEASFEQAERVIEGVIHDPVAGVAERQRSKALGLGFELEQRVAIEGRASGEISGGDGFIEKIEQLLVVGGCTSLAASSDEHILTMEFKSGRPLLTDRPI